MIHLIPLIFQAIHFHPLTTFLLFLCPPSPHRPHQLFNANNAANSVLLAAYAPHPIGYSKSPIPKGEGLID
jgi:hypothetical protein